MTGTLCISIHLDIGSV